MSSSSSYLTLPGFFPSAKGVSHFFGTRFAPAQWMTEQEIGVVSKGPDEWPSVMAVKQVHGTDVFVMDRLPNVGDSLAGGWDAIVTNQSGLLVTIRTADCVPVLIHDGKARAVAGIHAGWRGAIKGIVPKTIRALVDRFGCAPSELKVAIGPSAGACCYEVDAPVLQQLREYVDAWESVVELTNSNRGLLNLKQLVRNQAIVSGVLSAHIHSLDLCTMCRQDLFFSFRREGTRRGTMVNGIMLNCFSDMAT